MSPFFERRWHRNKRHPVTKLKRRSRLVKLKLLRINDPPERIARGVALGVFCGIAPTFGFGGFIAFGLAFIFKANKAASILGSFITNPVTTPFIWTLSIMLGSTILGVEYTELLETIKKEGFMAGFSSAYVVFLLGNAIMAAVSAFLSYHLVKRGISVHRRHKTEKRELRTRHKEG